MAELAPRAAKLAQRRAELAVAIGGRAEVAVQQADELGGRRAEAAARAQRGEHLVGQRAADDEAAHEARARRRLQRRAEATEGELAREVLPTAAVDAGREVDADGGLEEARVGDGLVEPPGRGLHDGGEELARL